MNIDITHSNITSDVCQRCAACCKISFKISNTSSRYRKFLRQIGFNVRPPMVDGTKDCCEDQHDITVDMGYCKHLEIYTEDSGTHYQCSLYGTDDLPELCTDFDCVSWAKFSGTYSGDNKTLVEAQDALDQVRDSKRRTTID
jgi:hypothetical protein